MREIALFSWKLYTAGTNFTQPPVVTIATNLNSVLYMAKCIAGEMIEMLMDREFFPTGLTSFVNIQRQFFDSFVGQTFKVKKDVMNNIQGD